MATKRKRGWANPGAGPRGKRKRAKRLAAARPRRRASAASGSKPGWADPGPAARGARRRKLPSAEQRIQEIIHRLEAVYPPKCALEHASALELLVATILSAQCTDTRVNLVTQDLFKKYRTAGDYATANPKVFEREIQSTGFFRNKTKSIIGMAQALLERHQGQVPGTMEQLTQLPGVGRKTANVVLGTWFGKNEGVVVDTHVARISRLLGLTKEEDAAKIEQDLMRLLPRDKWTPFAHMMIWHGRKTCIARRPRCGECVVNDLCPSSSV